MSLRVGYDASAAAVPHPTGVGLAIREQVAALREGGELELEVLYLLSRFRRRQHFLPGPRRLFHERWSPLLARRLDVFHGPDTRLPRFRGPALVATVHDFSARQPGFSDARFRATRERHWADVAARAQLVVTYTEAVRGEVHDALGFPPERIAVCPLAPTRQSQGATPAQVEAARARYAQGAPYVLVVGELSARKNTLQAVRAFAQSALSDHRLLLVGPDGFGAEEVAAEVARRGLGERVLRPAYLPAAEVAALLAGASVFFFPTRYEGFGMPLLEAFAAGVPVVTADAASVLEVASGAARSAAADDAAGLAAALSEVGRDAALRARLIQAGAARLADFSWPRTAARLAAIYRTAAGGGDLAPELCLGAARTAPPDTLGASGAARSGAEEVSPCSP